jgi:hypothetical protein
MTIPFFLNKSRSRISLIFKSLHMDGTLHNVKAFLFLELGCLPSVKKATGNQILSDGVFISNTIQFVINLMWLLAKPKTLHVKTVWNACYSLSVLLNCNRCSWFRALALIFHWYLICIAALFIACSPHWLSCYHLTWCVASINLLCWYYSTVFSWWQVFKAQSNT